MNRGCIQLFKKFGVELFIPYKFPTFLRDEKWVRPEKTSFFVGNVMGKIFDPNHSVAVTYLDKIERNNVTLVKVDEGSEEDSNDDSDEDFEEDSNDDSDEDSDEDVEANNAEDIDKTAISNNNKSEGDGSFSSVSKLNIESEEPEDHEEAAEKEESSSSEDN